MLERVDRVVLDRALVERRQVPDVEVRGPEADRDDVALAAALAQPWATVVLSGAASVDVLRSNLRAREASPPDDLDALVEDSDAYWARRSALAWN